MKALRFWHLVLLTGTFIFPASSLRADSISVNLLPPDGEISGAPGSLIGWGYSIKNNNVVDWFVSTNLNSDSFQDATPTLLFDFPDVGPSDTVNESFDAPNAIGLFELLLEASAPNGFVNSGNFVLSGQWWDGDPFNGGNFVADAIDIALPYSVTVSAVGSNDAPEPSDFALMTCGVCLLVGVRVARMRRHFSFLPQFISVSVVHTALWTFLFAVAAMAQERGRDPGITRTEAEDILNELRQIRQLLQTQAKPTALPPRSIPQTGKLRIEGGNSLGSNDAPVTIVEFTDYQCPFCRQFQSTTFTELRKKYIDSGKVRFVIRDFPLDGHPDAMPAAEAARCAGDQGKFWQMHDALFEEHDKALRTSLVDQAGQLKLNVGMFRACVESGKHKPEIQSDVQLALSLQIMATPSFVIGKTTGEDLEGVILTGAQPFSVFEAKLKEAAAQKF